MATRPNEGWFGDESADWAAEDGVISSKRGGAAGSGGSATAC
jgi:hypothetical protein